MPGASESLLRLTSSSMRFLRCAIVDGSEEMSLHERLRLVRAARRRIPVCVCVYVCVHVCVYSVFSVLLWMGVRRCRCMRG